MEDNYLHEQAYRDNNYQYDNNGQYPEQGQTLPNAVASMVLGICSLVFGCPVVGLVLAIIGLNKAKKAYAINEQYPGYYTGVGFAKAGKITSIVGIVLGILLILYCIAVLALVFYTGSFEEFLEALD